MMRRMSGATVVMLAGLLAVALLAAVPDASPATAQSTPITTVAGTGVPGYSGNGGQATAARLNEPYAVGTDSKGDVYVADYLNCVVRKITPAGVISTVAGNGVCGSSGIGGPATQASISNPAGLAMDGNGNLYIADRNNCQVLVVPPDGTIWVKAGDGVCGYSGDGGPATAASLSQVEGLAVDSVGDLFLADTNNCVVREVNTHGTIYTVVGDGVCGYSGDGGAPTAAELLGPEGVAVDSMSSTVYVADTGNCIVRAMHKGVIATVAGTPGSCGESGNGGAATSATLDAPFAIAVDSAGNVDIADTLGCSIRTLSTSGTITTSAGTGICGYAGDNGPPTAAELDQPFGVAVAPSGDVLVADTLNNRVREYGTTPPMPIVTSVSPSSGPVAGGDQVTIRGLDLLGATAVAFGSTPAAAFSVVSNAEIIATAPPGPAAGAREDITVTTPAGTSPRGTSDGFLFVTAGPYHPLAPARIADSRTGSGMPNQGDTLGPGESLDVQVAGAGGVPATGAVAAVINLTATDTTSVGYLTAYPSGIARPLASSLNFPAEGTVPNLVEVALGAGGRITVYNSAGSTNVIVDVEGWVGAGAAGTGLLEPLAPARIADTRTGSGRPDSGRTLGPQGALNVVVAGVGGVPATDVAAVVLNVTVTDTTAGSYLTVWPTGSAEPVASNLNWQAGQTVPNRVVVPVGFGGMVSVFNNSGSADVIVDVSGWFTGAANAQVSGSRFFPSSPVRVADTRAGSGEPDAGSTLGPGGRLPIQIAGVGGVPGGGVPAVVLDVAVTQTTSFGYLTVFPAGDATPPTSDLNWTAGETTANCVVVKLGSGGRIVVFNSAGSTDVIVDVVGWYL